MSFLEKGSRESLSFQIYPVENHRTFGKFYLKVTFKSENSGEDTLRSQKANASAPQQPGKLSGNP